MWNWTLSWINNFSSNNEHRHVYKSSYVHLTSKVIKVSGLAYTQTTIMLEFNAECLTKHQHITHPVVQCVGSLVWMRDVKRPSEVKISALPIIKCGPQANYLTSLSFSFPICKVGILTIILIWLLWGVKEIMYAHHSIWFVINCQWVLLYSFPFPITFYTDMSPLQLCI